MCSLRDIASFARFALWVASHVRTVLALNSYSNHAILLSSVNRLSPGYPNGQKIHIIGTAIVPPVCSFV